MRNELARITSRRSLVVTLSIDSNAVRLMAADGRRIVAWGSKSLEPGVVRNGLIRNIEAVASIAESLLSKVDLTKTQIVACASGVRSLPRLIRIPKIERRLLKEAVRFESERQFPLPVDDLYLPQVRIADSDTEHQFFVIGVPKNFIDAQVQTFEILGPKSYTLDLKPLALARAVARKEAVIIDLEPETPEIVLLADGLPVLIRTIIMGEQRLPNEESVNQMAQEVSRTLEHYNAGHPERAFDASIPVFLTGKLASNATVIELLKASFSNPIAEIEVPFRYPDGFPIAEYATNIGLALNSKVSRKSKNQFLLPALDLEILTESQKPSHSVKKGVALAVAAAISLAFFYPMAALDTEGRTEAAGLRQELDNARSQLEEARQVSKAIDSAIRKAKRVAEEAEVILGTDSSFAEGIELVFGDAPAGITIKLIRMTGGSITLEGSASNRSSVIDYATDIESRRDVSAVYIDSLTISEGGAGEPTLEFSFVVERQPFDWR